MWKSCLIKCSSEWSQLRSYWEGGLQGWQQNRSCVSAKGWELHKNPLFRWNVPQHFPEVFHKELLNAKCKVSTFNLWKDSVLPCTKEIQTIIPRVRLTYLKHHLLQHRVKPFIQARPQKLQKGKATGSCCADFIFLAIFMSSFGFIWNPLARLTEVTKIDARPCRWGAELAGEGMQSASRWLSQAGQMAHPCKTCIMVGE